MTLDEAIKRYTDNAEYERTHGSLQGCLDFKQLAEWLKELKQLREQTRWISVDDRLPKNGEDVLVYFSQGDMAVAYYHIDDTYYPTQYADLNETGWFNEDGDALYFEPIAWMSLPKRYEPQESEVGNEKFKDI